MSDIFPSPLGNLTVSCTDAENESGQSHENKNANTPANEGPIVTQKPSSQRPTTGGRSNAKISSPFITSSDADYQSHFYGLTVDLKVMMTADDLGWLIRTFKSCAFKPVFVGFLYEIWKFWYPILLILGSKHPIPHGTIKLLRGFWQYGACENELLTMWHLQHELFGKIPPHLHRKITVFLQAYEGPYVLSLEDLRDFIAWLEPFQTIMLHVVSWMVDMTLDDDDDDVPCIFTLMHENWKGMPDRYFLAPDKRSEALAMTSIFTYIVRYSVHLQDALGGQLLSGWLSADSLEHYYITLRYNTVAKHLVYLVRARGYTMKHLEERLGYRIEHVKLVFYFRKNREQTHETIKAYIDRFANLLRPAEPIKHLQILDGTNEIVTQCDDDPARPIANESTEDYLVRNFTNSAKNNLIRASTLWAFHNDGSFSRKHPQLRYPARLQQDVDFLHCLFGVHLCS